MGSIFKEFPQDHKMLRFNTLLYLTATLFLAGCFEKSADTSSPKSYNSDLLTFQYPGNWKIGIDSEVGILTLESPGDAIVTIQTEPPHDKIDLDDLAKNYSADFIKELPIGKHAIESFAALENQSGFERILEKFTVTVLGESIGHHRMYAGKDGEERDYFLVFQVPSEDFEKTKPGFDLILKTLKTK